jgi:hypothetical protein
MEKISALEDNADLYRRLLASKDSTISDRIFQLQAMQLVVSNQNMMLKNKEEETALLNASLQRALKTIQKRKKWPLVTAGAGAVLAIFAPKIIKLIF